MKKLLRISVFIFSIFIIHACKKDKATPPVISTTYVTQISPISAVSGGTITDNGGAIILSKGVCWNTSDKPTMDNNKTSETGESLSFTSNILQLLPSTSYYVRAYAVNSAGTSYGNSVFFKTIGDKPTSNSQNASNIQLTTATLNGTVNPNSLETTVTFEYGITTSYGSTAIARQSPLSGDSEGNVSIDLTELSIGTTYHFRIKAENSLGIIYSSDLSFTTLGSVPALAIGTATNIQVNSATLNCSVNANYLSTTIIFEWGTTTGYGNSVTAIQSPLNGGSSTPVSAKIAGLLPGTTYHYRVRTENELGSVLSNDMNFTTLTPLTDIDGNIYNIVTIGTQVWMAENLKTTKYNNGSDIPLKTNSDFWQYTTTQPGYCWYNNDEATNKNTYGALYNWYAVHTGNICPTGWHIPTDDECITLILYVGENVGGNKLKEAGNTHWSTPSTIATNEYGFTALPGGERYSNFTNLGISGTFWSNTAYDFQNSYTVQMNYNYSGVTRYTYQMSTGLSVRCLKDN